MNKNKKILILIVSIIAISMVAGGFFIFKMKIQDNNTRHAIIINDYKESVTTSTAVINEFFGNKEKEWKIHENKKLGFSIEYREDWSAYSENLLSRIYKYDQAIEIEYKIMNLFEGYISKFDNLSICQYFLADISEFIETEFKDFKMYEAYDIQEEESIIGQCIKKNDDEVYFLKIKWVTPELGKQEILDILSTFSIIEPVEDPYDYKYPSITKANKDSFVVYKDYNYNLEFEYPVKWGVPNLKIAKRLENILSIGFSDLLGGATLFNDDYPNFLLGKDHNSPIFDSSLKANLNTEQLEQYFDNRKVPIAGNWVDYSENILINQKSGYKIVGPSGSYVVANSLNVFFPNFFDSIDYPHLKFSIGINPFGIHEYTEEDMKKNITSADPKNNANAMLWFVETIKFLSD